MMRDSSDRPKSSPHGAIRIKVPSWEFPAADARPRAVGRQIGGAIQKETPTIETAESTGDPTSNDEITAF